MPNASSAQGLAPGSAGTDRALATSTKSVHLDRDRPMKLTVNTLVDPVSRGRQTSRSDDSGATKRELSPCKSRVPARKSTCVIRGQRKSMKRYLFAVLIVSLAMPILAVEPLVSVAEGTVRKIDSTARTILVAAKDGAERTFHFADRTVVHGVEGLGKGSKEGLHGLMTGSEVAVNYTTKGTVDTAEEIDHIGKDGLKATEGTVKKIDRDAKTITIATADGTEQTFRLLDHAARDAGTDIEKGSDRTAKVTVYYTEEGGAEIAHFFKKAF